MSKWFLGGLTSFVFVASLLVWGYAGRREPPTTRGTEASPKPGEDVTAVSQSARLRFQRLSPPPESGEVVDCTGGSFVKFCYEVENPGSRAVRGVRLDLQCGCEAASPVPAEIGPGATAVVCFRLRAPPFGTLRREVHLLSGESLEPLARFPVALYAPVQPPMLLRVEDSVGLTYIAGDDALRQLTFTAIEKRSSAPWIEGLSLEPHDLARIDSFEIDEAREPDTELIRRTYRVGIRGGHLPIGWHSGTLRLRSRDSEVPSPSPIPFTVNVIDRVSLVPNPLVFTRDSHHTARVVAVFRNGEGAAYLEHYDDSLLRVQAVGPSVGRAVSFMLSPTAAASNEDRETQVVIRVDERETRELRVLLSGARR